MLPTGTFFFLIFNYFFYLFRFLLIIYILQLISRICHSTNEVWEILRSIIAKVLLEYPQQGLWTMIALSKSNQRNRFYYNKYKNEYHIINLFSFIDKQEHMKFYKEQEKTIHPWRDYKRRYYNWWTN